MDTCETSANDQISIVSGNTLLLAEELSNCIDTMIGRMCSVENGSYRTDRHWFGGMVFFVPFSGTIQGYYIMSIEEESALGLLGRPRAAGPEGRNTEDLEDAIGFCKEALNTAVGQAVVELEKAYGYLSYFAPVAVTGRIGFPPLLTGSMNIATPEGVITCGIMLDLVKPRIAQKLTTTLSDLRQKTKEAVTDGLTKVYNRAFFDDFLRKAMDEQKRVNNQIGLIMVDVDHFKELNDSLGHQCGDAILKAIAGIFHTILSETDIPARFGGDEFIIALPNRVQSECIIIAERIRCSVRESLSQHIGAKNALRPEVTVSIGVTYLLPEDTFEEFVSRVDKLLYSAKRAGRNTFVCG